METKIIKAVFGGGISTVTNKRTRTDYGQVLEIIGIDLPDTFECIFSNSNTSAGTGKKMIGSNQRCLIPDEYLATGQTIYAWILLHDTEDDGRHMYSIRIPVADMPNLSPEEPTPVEQSVISQAITALNSAVETTAQKASEAYASADRAEHAAEGVEGYAERAEAAQQAAENARDIALEAKVSAQASAATASEKASEAISSATTASQSAITAENASESAQASATASAESASQASQSADTASAKATEASGYASNANASAQTASQKASEAAQSASTAVQAKTDAESAKTASETAQGLAETARNEAVTAKTDAESARDAAAQSASEAAASASQAAESARTLTIDPTFSKSGQAADAKAVGDEIADLKDDLSYSGLDISGNKIYFPTHHGMCLNSSGSGYNHIDINAPTINPQWNAYLIPSIANDTFTIFTVGGMTTYAYAFIDSNGDILLRSASNYTANGLEITAPENSAYLVVNDKGGNSRVYRNVLLSKRVKAIEDLGVASFPNEIAFRNFNIVFYVADGGQIQFTPAGSSPVDYTIGNKNYILRFKGNNYEITPAQISAAATAAGLTATNGVISYTSYMIYFDVESETVKVAKDISTAINRLIQAKNPVIFYAHYASIRSGLAVDYMNLWRIQNAETGITKNTADISRINDVVGNDIVPSFFDSNLSAKIPEIIDNMNDAGPDGTTFVFITDIHWETNYKNSPALVKRVLDKTSVKNVFCGGDIINEGEKELMYETFLDCINHYRFVPNNGFFPIARGNHDDNSNWSSNEDVTKYAFDNNTIYNLLYSQFADRVTRIGSNWAFYFDQEATKTRYIFVDTKRNGLVIDYSAIINCLNTVNANWHVVFLMHFTLRNATTLFDGCSLLGHVVKAYNNRQSGSYEGAYQTATYDFTDAKGTVDLIIGGHMHADYAMNADDANNPAGVPIIATDTDSYRNHTGTEGTVDSQCFDVVTVNYEAKTIKCVRIGRGSDRQFNY